MDAKDAKEVALRKARTEAALQNPYTQLTIERHIEGGISVRSAEPDCIVLFSDIGPDALVLALEFIQKTLVGGAFDPLAYGLICKERWRVLKRIG